MHIRTVHVVQVFVLVPSTPITTFTVSHTAVLYTLTEVEYVTNFGRVGERGQRKVTLFRVLKLLTQPSYGKEDPHGVPGFLILTTRETACKVNTSKGRVCWWEEH